MPETPQHETPLTRREWLRTVGRVGALGGLVISLGVLASRNKCAAATPCASCQSFPSCDDDRARQAREGGAP